METEELMFGDLVLHIENNNRTIVKVENIHGEEINIVFDADGEFFGIHCSHIEPIPLTEEILKVNGFIHNEHNLWYIPFNQTNFVIEESVVDDKATFFIRVYCPIQIKYVHKLQHALRLCGLDTLANEFKIKD